MTSEHSARHPIDQLADEFVARYRRGERPLVTEYAQRYPELASQIGEVLQALVLMEELGPGPEKPAGVAAPKAPRQLGEYRLLREVGRGGMGVVYEAEQESLGRHVALKVLPVQVVLDHTQLERFRREAKAVARLHHTNIVPVFGVGEQEGVHYYAMQFIQGQGLHQVLQEVQRLRHQKEPAPADKPALAGHSDDVSRARASSLAQALCSGQFALAGAASRQVGPASRAGPAPLGSRGLPQEAVPALAPPPSEVQVPVCPSREAASPRGSASTDIRLAATTLSSWSESDERYFHSVARIGVDAADALAYMHGQGIQHRDIKPSNLMLDMQGTVWVTDFGLAKAEGLPDLTHTGDIVGTLRYLAPERLSGQSDPRSDLYSLGLTLYELLTLRPAFEGTERVHLLQQITTEEPPRLRRLDRRIPRDLETIVHKAIAKEPGQRYASAGKLAEDLRRFLADKPIEARRTTWREHLWRWCRRNRIVASLCGLSLVLFLTGFLTVAWQWQRAEAEKTKADQEREEADRQRTRAQGHYQKALEAVDRMLTRVGQNRLTHIPQMEEERRKLLEDALEFYRGFLQEQSTDPAIRQETGRAYGRTATIYELLGQIDRAEETGRQALAIHEQLAAEFPGEPQYRHDLAKCHHDLGYLYLFSTRMAQAEAAYRRSLEVEQPLVEAYPGNADYRHLLAKTHSNLVILYRRMGQLDRAEAAGLKGLDLAERLLRDHSENADYQRILAGIHLNLGPVYNALERRPQAVAAYQKAIAISQRLAHDHPDTLDNAKLLAKAYNNLGLVYWHLREYAQAEEAYRQALAIHERLLQEHPKVIVYATDVSGTCANLGQLARDRHDSEGALPWYERALDILEPAFEREPRDTEIRFNLFNALFGHGLTLKSLGRVEEATRDWKRLLAVSEGQSDIRMRLYRPPPLARVGEHARATQEAEALVAEGHTQGLNLYNFAYVHALCAAAARQDTWLPPAEQEQVAERYGARAVELLALAKAAGHFHSPGRLDHLETDRDLDPIRSRPDFQKLLAELEEQQ